MLGNVNRCWLTLLILAGFVAIPGCSGCRPDATTQNSEDDEDEPREDFTSGELNVLPNDETMAAYGLKPGHWFSVSQRLKANKADFYGESTGFAGGKSRTPVPVLRTPFELTSRRPVVLPKGQSKTFEQSVFIPSQSARRQQVWIYSDLASSYRGTAVHTQPQVVNRLRPHQNYFVVLASRPDAYGFLKSMESIVPPGDVNSLQPIRGDYVTVLPKATRQTPLPSFSLMWSTVSYVLWDDYEPTRLTPLQQRAMLDWIRWGGQLIISGPESMDTLRSSFLGEYLPADVGERSQISEAAIAELDDRWSVRALKPNLDPKFPRKSTAGTEVVKLTLSSQAKFVPRAGELLAERRVGRGRIVVTGFSLTSRQFLTWRRFDNFFNGAVLRRPARSYRYSDSEGTTNQWATHIEEVLRRRPAREATPYLPELSSNDQNPMSFELQSPRVPNESFLTSRLRYFTRDAAFVRSDTEDDPALTGYDIEGYRCDAQTGVGGWNDFSDSSKLARDALTSAAGITVPERSFIVYALGIYLLALVPINWIVFKLLGRVEWAWAAVPLIAIAGTIAVVKLAQLDIGFARSRTEVAVLETQPNSDIGHLTRYIGLYTSLSTNYVLSYEDESALALPFSTGASQSEIRRLPRQNVYFERVDRDKAKVHMGGLGVRSNSTGMVHSEQMLPMSGDFEYDERSSGLIQVANNSVFDFRDVGAIRRREGRLEFAWVGRFPSGASKRIQFARVDAGENDLSKSWESFGTAIDDETPFDFGRFLALAAEGRRINEGDVRLIGWTENELPGLTIEPAASQRSFRTLLVAHLRYGDLPLPQSDDNAPDDFDPDLQGTVPYEGEDDRTN